MSRWFQLDRTVSNGWDTRFLSIGRMLFGYATIVKGEPLEGPWISAAYRTGPAGSFVRFGIYRWGCAVGVTK